MKKIMLFLLCVVLLISSMAGCSGNNEETSETTEPESTTESEESTTEETEDITYENVDFSQTIYDDEQVTVEAEGAVWEISDSTGYYDITMHLENHTEKDLIFDIGTVAVEGIMVDYAYLYQTVEAGDSVYAVLEISGNELAGYSISDPTWISAQLDVYDAETYDETGYPYNYSFDLYPHGQEEALYRPYTVQSSDVVLIDELNIKLILSGAYDDGDNFEVTFIYENDTDEPVYFNPTAAKLNGKEIYVTGGKKLLPDTIAFGNLVWDSEELSSVGLTIDEITQAIISWSVFNYVDGTEICVENTAFSFTS